MTQSQIIEIPLEQIVTGRANVRKHIGNLEELKESRRKDKWVCTALGRAGAVFCALAPALLVCFRFEFGKLVDKIYFCGLDKIRSVWYNMRRINSRRRKR